MTFYGQHLEDEYINTHIFPNKNNGVCIEIGAYDGEFISNTLYFEKKGWRALCIEPIEEAFLKCSKIRKECYQYCMGETDSLEEKEFTIYNLNDNLCAISSLEPDKRLIDRHGYLIKDIYKCKTKVRSCNSLLSEINFPTEIDFISIDTENTELDVLKGIDLNKYNVKLFIVENNFNDPFCEEYLKQYGYEKIHSISVNDFFMRKS
jgi:FkbM family methyltransferase